MVYANELESDFTQWVAISGRVLGVLFYHPPSDERVRSVLPLFKQDNWVWGGIVLDKKIRADLGNHDRLDEAYQELFLGPNALPAPPWGSVYLDKESVLFGDSTQALQAFMHAHQIDFSSGMYEPEDHIGLLLMLAAYLAENKPDLLPVFLKAHVLTWGYRYLALMGEQTRYPFYCALAQLTQLTLENWQQTLAIPPAKVRLYR